MVSSCFKIDTTQSTASDRMAFYINGTQRRDPDVVTTQYPSQNFEFNFVKFYKSYHRKKESWILSEKWYMQVDIHYVSGYAYDATHLDILIVRQEHGKKIYRKLWKCWST